MTKSLSDVSRGMTDETAIAARVADVAEALEEFLERWPETEWVKRRALAGVFFGGGRHEPQAQARSPLPERQGGGRMVKRREHPRFKAHAPLTLLESMDAEMGERPRPVMLPIFSDDVRGTCEWCGKRSFFRKQTGSIYVVGEDASGPVKVGLAVNVKDRVASLQSGNFRPLIVYETCVFALYAEAAMIEAEFHQRARREGLDVLGEWHALTAGEAVELLAGLCEKRRVATVMTISGKVIGVHDAETA